jgi:hypothetical protein
MIAFILLPLRRGRLWPLWVEALVAAEAKFEVCVAVVISSSLSKARLFLRDYSRGWWLGVN